MIVRCEIEIDVIRRNERNTKKEDLKEITTWPNPFNSTY